jgi:hypothetical protein
MGRPVGKRILQCRDFIERIGPSTAAQVHQHIQEIDIENVHKYCSRAVGLRLLSVDRSGRPKIFRVVDKSVANVEPGPEPEPVPEIMPEPHYLHGIWR